MDIKAMDTVMSSKWKIHLKEHVVVYANVILFKFLSYTKKRVGSNPIFYTIDFRTLEHLAGSNQLRDERLLEWAVESVEPSDCFVVFPPQAKMKVSSGRSKRTPGRCLDAIKIRTMKSRKKKSFHRSKVEMLWWFFKVNFQYAVIYLEFIIQRLFWSGYGTVRPESCIEIIINI